MDKDYDELALQIIEIVDSDIHTECLIQIDEQGYSDIVDEVSNILAETE